MGFIPKIVRKTDDQRRADAERELIRQEAIIGGQLFGPIPQGHRRDFFCLDEHTWVWHEEWLENNQRKAVTTRYDVRPSGVLKSQVGQPYQPLSADEAKNFYLATQQYGQHVGHKYQQLSRVN